MDNKTRRTSASAVLKGDYNEETTLTRLLLVGSADLPGLFVIYRGDGFKIGLRRYLSGEYFHGSLNAHVVPVDAVEYRLALGGNALSGGKFNMAASILGAYVIQFLTTTLYKLNVQSDALSAYKAVVVIILVVLSAPSVREKLSSLGKKLKPQSKEVA